MPRMEKEEFDRLSPDEQKAHLAGIERYIMAPGHWPEVSSLQLGILIRASADIPVAVEEVMLSMQERSEEHTSELQSLMRISYAVFCLKKKKQNIYIQTYNTPQR